MGDRPADGPAGEPAGIRTFLIADVRGYTLFTQERGDEAAAKLAARFAGIAREAVEEHGGSVIELRGDEALAVFASARQAILAAIRAQDRFLEETLADPTLPLPVGIGLDAGEAVPVEGGYRGGALNLAARLVRAGRRGRDPGEPGRDPPRSEGRRRANAGSGRAASQEPVGARPRLPADLRGVRSRDPVPRVRSGASRSGRPPRSAWLAPIRSIAVVVALALIAAVAVPAGLALRSGGGSGHDRRRRARRSSASTAASSKDPLRSHRGPATSRSTPATAPSG